MQVHIDTIEHVLPIDHLQLVAQVMSMAQKLCEQELEEGVVVRLCQEVARLTNHKAQLLLHHKKVKQLSSSFAVNLPVAFRGKEYGVLSLAGSMGYLASPDFPLMIAALIANVCGWTLYTLEQATFIEGRSSQCQVPINIHLTSREKEVLLLIGHGYDNEKIAELLSITMTTVVKHRQNIYEQLGVHNKQDALLVAYRSGLFSPFEACG